MAASQGIASMDRSSMQSATAFLSHRQELQAPPNKDTWHLQDELYPWIGATCIPQQHLYTFVSYIKMERNLGGTSTGKCGIAMEASYPVKEGQNPPNPGPSPPSPEKPPAECDSYFSCPKSNTCCCVFEYGNYCFQWGCCLLEAATCCDDHESCRPQDFPVCNVNVGTCMLSKDNPFGVMAMKRTAAKPNWAFLKGEKRSSS